MSGAAVLASCCTPDSWNTSHTDWTRARKRSPVCSFSLAQRAGACGTTDLASEAGLLNAISSMQRRALASGSHIAAAVDSRGCAVHVVSCRVVGETAHASCCLLRFVSHRGPALLVVSAQGTAERRRREKEAPTATASSSMSEWTESLRRNHEEEAGLTCVECVERKARRAGSTPTLWRKLIYSRHPNRLRGASGK